MLFAEERNEIIQNGIIYFTATARHKINDKLLHIIAIKHSSNDIHTILEYHHLDVEESLPVETKFDKVLTPAKMEEFIHRIALRLNQENKENALVEFKYPSVAIEDYMGQFSPLVRRMFQHVYIILATRKNEQYATALVADLIKVIVDEKLTQSQVEAFMHAKVKEALSQ